MTGRIAHIHLFSPIISSSPTSLLGLHVCVVRKADSWGWQCSKQAASRDAVVPLRSCRHGSVTMGAFCLAVETGPRHFLSLHSQIITTFPLCATGKYCCYSLLLEHAWEKRKKQRKNERLCNARTTGSESSPDSLHIQPVSTSSGIPVQNNCSALKSAFLMLVM